MRLIEEKKTTGVRIHSTAIVDKTAALGSGVEVGPFSIIGAEVEIGDGCRIASHVLVDEGTILGKNCRIHHGAVLGTIPQDLKFEGEKTILRLGDNNIVREYATLNRGTKERGETTIGSGCLFMAYSHVAHDCVIGDGVILANCVNFAGHVRIGDFAIIGGLVPVHQFVHVGEHAIIGGGYRVPKDVCPYSMVAGNPLKTTGLNLVGLKRRGFSTEAIRILKEAFKLLFFSKLSDTQCGFKA
ncbi:MAG: acyl-ACP--UDP-N-acetylglucosamine O-acyltransferase, partial [Candidatus Zixiibacteriota bacterium]